MEVDIEAVDFKRRTSEMSAMARDTGSSFRWSVGTLAALLILLSLFGTGSALKQPKCDNIASAASNHTELNTTLAQ